MDLFDIAAKNGRDLSKRLTACGQALAPTERHLLKDFVKKVKTEGVVSINMRPWVLTNFFSSGKYQNIYEWAQEQSGLSGQRMDDLLKAKLKSYYVRRTAFDAAFTNGQKFRYGILQVGGLGAIGYGEYCLVLNIDFAIPGSEIAYLEGDSLNTYTDTAGVLDVVSLRKGVAPHSHRQHLAGIKHAAQVPSTPKGNWSAMLCSGKDYVEVIFTTNVGPDNVDHLRMPQSEENILHDLAFKSFGMTLAAGTQALTNDYIQILRAARDHSLRLERL